MANIDGFLDHFDAEPALHPAMRLSLRRMQPRRRESFETSNVLLWLLVALLHVGLFLALDFAIRPLPIVHDAADAPMQVTIIRLPELAVPGVTAQPVRQPDIHRLPHPQHVLPRADTALQAIPIPPRTVMQTATTPTTDTRPALDLYDRQGRIRLPAPAIVMRRDPFARRSAADMLPGGRAFAPGIRLRAQTSPKQMVEGIAAYLFRAPPVETCPQYEQRVLNADNEKERDEDLDRYLRECPGG